MATPRDAFIRAKTAELDSLMESLGEQLAAQVYGCNSTFDAGEAHRRWMARPWHQRARSWLSLRAYRARRRVALWLCLDLDSGGWDD